MIIGARDAGRDPSRTIGRYRGCCMAEEQRDKERAETLAGAAREGKAVGGGARNNTAGALLGPRAPWLRAAHPCRLDRGGAGRGVPLLLDGDHVTQDGNRDDEHPPDAFPESAHLLQLRGGVAGGSLRALLPEHRRHCRLRDAGVLFTSALAGHAFARMRFPGRQVLFVLLLATLMIPFESAADPRLHPDHEAALGRHLPGDDRAVDGERLRHLPDAPVLPGHPGRVVGCRAPGWLRARHLSEPHRVPLAGSGLAVVAIVSSRLMERASLASGGSDTPSRDPAERFSLGSPCSPPSLASLPPSHGSRHGDDPCRCCCSSSLPSASSWRASRTGVKG